MRLSWLRPSVVFPLSLACAAASGPTPAKAQTYNWSTFGIGYVANAPTMMAGAGAYVLFPALKGFGLYVNATFDPSSPAHDPYFLKDTTSALAQDVIPSVEYQYNADSWQSFNVAVVKPVTSALMLYVGTGYSKKRTYDHFQDPSQTHGQLGAFWAEDPRFMSSTIGFNFGGFFRMGRHLAFQTGITTRPVGFTLGGLLKFPGR